MRVLIVSPHFPPVNAPDLHRIRASLPEFVNAGWHVTVLTVDDPTPLAPLEPELLATIPPAVDVVRAHCGSRRWTGMVGVNNVGLRSLPFLFWRGLRLLSAERYDVVYFSTTMFVTLPLARLWRALTGVPYVIDLQDPWVNDFYDRPGAPRPPGGWKYAWSQRAARLLEGWTLRRASHLISVSSNYINDLRARHPDLVRLPATVIPFGASESDLAHVAARQGPQRFLPADGNRRLGFAGALGPGMMPAVEVLLAAVAELRAESSAWSVHLYGTSYAPGAPKATTALVARSSVADLVHEQPARLGYLDALQVTLEADVNLLFGSTDLGFVPSKLASTLAAGRPVLAIAPHGSALVARLSEAGVPCITFEPGAATAGAVRGVAALLRAFSVAGSNRPNPSLPAGWSAAALATRQLEILHSVAVDNQA